MGTEIERKFRVDRLDGSVALGPGERIRQGYLAEEGDVEVRLRITSAGAVLTVKVKGDGLARTEVECPLDAGDATALWPHTAGRQLDKVRHRVDLGAHTAEVDIYEGALDGIVVVEVEFDSEQEADAFSPPAWFGEELTGRAEWSNASLARRPPPM